MSTTSPTTATHKEIVRRYLLAIPARDAVAKRSVLASKAHLEGHVYQDTLHQYDVTLDPADGPVAVRTASA
jgi:hypothetical protein